MSELNRVKLSKEDVQELIANRRYFHQHPEPSLREYNTSKKIKELLELWQIPYVSVGETGVLGTIQGKKDATKDVKSSKTILLRADIDALEMKDRKDVPYCSTIDGMHHACGHDGHTASLLAAAKYLKSHENDFSGTIKLAFQQAEEIGAGARLFVQGGHLEDVDLAFGIHLSSEYPTGKIILAEGSRYASCDIFKLHIEGESSHAAKPHQGRDALLAASHVVVALQSVVARCVDPIDSAVLSIGVLNAGTRYNVVANDAYIEGTVRALQKETRVQILSQVEEIAKLTSAVHRCTSEFSDYSAANILINQKEATDFAVKVAKNLVGDENVITSAPPTLGAEDFADYGEVTAATFALVGTRNLDNDSTHYPHHHELFDIDEEGLVVAAELHAQIALDFLAED